ncbi:3-hydroxyphenylacetate 6-hydroxylase [Cercospora beticola]|uniref:3-hydroxyphenylacetate 6-hydroxylase n=1 Tax=Cercospora beticola TaxID=122368 RepID=A0A2G5HLM5_CERBT|nr:3-hydroxyphenylacetate 6-hydroxylase [Cercospora beticola]PIA93466.1 3-hydroxyphenylacetate 6-hydroxylase [Cercospora beticola]
MEAALVRYGQSTVVNGLLLFGVVFLILVGQNQCKLLSRIAWTINRALGGAPHGTNLPGPSGWPILGNLYDMKDGHIQKLKEWQAKYGDVIRCELGEREMVVINSHKALAETVVQQNIAYSSRPIFKLFHSDYASNGIWTVGTSPINDSVQRTRKAFNAQVTPRVLPTYTKVIHPKLKKLLGEVFGISKGHAVDMADILHRFGTGQVSEQLMGLPLDDDTVAMLAENETNIFRQRTVGFPARDYVPILRGVKRIIYSIGKTLGIESWSCDEAEDRARGYRRKQGVYIDKLLHDLKADIEAGTAPPSIMGNILKKNLLDDTQILLASYTGIAAGVNLGYALNWTEGSRVYTPVRLGFPRETLEGATYRGMKIPKGTLTIMNLYSANHDPNVFDYPDDFRPERWMNGHKGRTDMLEAPGDKIGVPILTFGAGRRACPGFEMASRGLYSTLVLLIHFFTWERQPMSEEAKKDVFPLFRNQRECSLEMDALADTATPTEAQAIPWACGIKFHCRDPEAMQSWLENNDM